MHLVVRSLLAVLALVFCLTATGRAQSEATVVRDQTALKRLLGTRGLTLQWVSWDKRGSLKAEMHNGVVSLRGEQRMEVEAGKGEDYVTVEGVVTEIKAKEFTFVGRIVTRVNYINGGQPCERQGTYTFQIKGNRKYWRMYPYDNPCDVAADYVDIYF